MAISQSGEQQGTERNGAAMT